MAPVAQKQNPTVSKKKKTKSSPVAITPATETLKRGSRKKVVVLEETPMQRIPRTKGKNSKVLVET